MKKKFLSLILSFACLALTVLPIAVQPASAEGELQQSGTPIDIYLLGGQSNAVGCSWIQNNPTTMYNNVWYAGEIERVVYEEKDNKGNAVLDEEGNPVFGTRVAQNWLKSFDDFKRYVAGGFGYPGEPAIGPEYGMAKVLNEQYTGETRALIFKTAYGGTYLHKVAGANWYPRSLWPNGYEPDTSKPFSGKNTMGILYQVFVENFEHVYNELVANGYAPQVKGMAWMQGEADAGDSTAKLNYFNNLKTFITDIRADVARITGDQTMLEMPFVIGRIAESFMQWNNPNTTMISNTQQNLADQMDNVYAVKTDDLIIVAEGDDPAKAKTHGSGGWDSCHYNFNDMVKLGERFAKAFNKAEKGTGISCSSSASLTPFVFALGVGVAAIFKKKKQG